METQDRYVVAVCIRCGHQGQAATRCAACGGVVIQTRQSQALRDSYRELSQSTRLPGVTADEDGPRRLARGTMPPTESGPMAAPVIADAAVPDLRGGRVIVAVIATLVAAGLMGLIAAVVLAAV
jgi:hypothetical protein